MSDDLVRSFRYLEDLLTRADGSRISVEEAVKKHYGYRIVWIAALNSEIRDRMREVRLRGYPPRIFLSYRWGDPELSAWVRSLALRLVEQGFEVLLDQFQVLQGSHLEVPRYVSSLASCHYALVVVNSAYCDVAGPRRSKGEAGPDGWVLDEHQWILRLSNLGLLQLFAVLREGDRLPEGFGPHNTIDVRSAADSAAALEAVAARFHYDGPVLSPTEQADLVRLVETSTALLGAGNPQAALDLLAESPRFTATMEHRQQQALALATLGRQEEALTLARGLLAEALPPQTALRMAGVLGTCGARQEALPHLVRLAKTQWSPAQVHYLLGNLLDDLGSFATAINHLRHARASAEGPEPGLLNDLGMVYRHAGRWEEAEECFAEALASAPTMRIALVNRAVALAALGRTAEAIEQCAQARVAHPEDPDVLALEAAIRTGRICREQPRPPMRGTSYECDRCGAHYHLEPRRQSICGDCGALYDGPRFHCPCCGNDGIVLVQMIDLAGQQGFAVACPICRKGRLGTITGGDDTAASSFSESASWVELASEGEPPVAYVNAEIVPALVPANRCLLLSVLAGVILHADEGAAHALHVAAVQTGEDPGGVLELTLEGLPRFTSEVEPKQYAPGERIVEPSQVIRGAARILNQLTRGDAATAREIADRFTWPRTQRLLYAGIGGHAEKLGEEDLAREMLAELSRERPSQPFSCP